MRMGEINVTPLVDVCLVLLIIFMVVTEKMTPGKDVPLPQTRNHSELTENDADLVITITSYGGKPQIWWDREEIQDTKALKERLANVRLPASTYLKADRDLSYGDVYPVLMAMHEAGARGTRLATTPFQP